MEAAEILGARVEKLWRQREGLESRVLRKELRIHNADERKKEPASTAKVAGESSDMIELERRGIATLRAKITEIDEQSRDLEERIDRIGGEEEEEGREVLVDEFERAIERASQRIERDQKVLERMLRELSWLR